MGHALFGEARAILSRLVAFNTEPDFSNLPLVEWVADYLAQHNIRADTKTTATDGTSKASLHAVIGPAISGGVVLSGHTDVVNATQQTWQSSPFELAERDGNLYARGSCDMKGFIACVLAQAPHFAAAKLNRPIHIALSRDEEIGSVGMPDMLALIAESKLQPAAALVGEPTMMRMVAGHKAGYEVRTVFSGVAAHSAIPAAGCSATVPAAQFALFLDSLNAEMAAAARADSPFDPPHGIINVGVIRGGVAFNIIAEHSEVWWHYRPLPDEDGEAMVERITRHTREVIAPAMRAGGHPATIQHHIHARYVGLPVKPQSPAAVLTAQLLGRDDWTVAPYGADAGAFDAAGIPAVLVGPGNIAQAHKPDEFVAVSQLESCLDFLDRLRAHLTA